MLIHNESGSFRGASIDADEVSHRGSVVQFPGSAFALNNFAPELTGFNLKENI